MKYFADAWTDQIGDHDEAGSVEHLDEIRQILHPEYPLESSRGADGYRRECVQNAAVTVAVATNRLQGLRHGGRVELSRTQNIDRAVLQELDRLLNQGNCDRIGRVPPIRVD